MPASETETRIREFVATSFGFRGATAQMDSQLDLLEQGILDSTAVLEVVAFVEDELGVKVADDEMIPDNFATIGRMTAFVDRKRRATS
jgi:acyl carrier protein